MPITPEKRAKVPWKIYATRSKSGKQYWFAKRNLITERLRPEIIHCDGDTSGAAAIYAIALTQE